MISAVAIRYAKALFAVTEASQQSDSVLNEMRALADSVGGKGEIKAYFASPVVAASEKDKVLTSLKGKLSQPVEQLLQIMNEKDRFSVISDVAGAFESLIDQKHGVTRGTVRSAAVLDPEQRKNLEETVRKVTGKQVILQFEVDPSLMGGLVAKVGGWTFDDSLTTHLTSLKEGLTRQPAP